VTPATVRATLALGILARPPVPGACKTRLIPELGADGAAAVQAQLIAQTLQLARASGLPTVLFTVDDPAAPYWQAQAAAWPREAQPEGDLGTRMAAALARLLATAERALIIGTDCPALTPDHLATAARLLDNADAVVLPAEDGGYVLIGARGRVPPLFSGIAWGEDRVLTATRTRAAAAGLQLAEGPTLWDVDTPEDCQRAQACGLLAPSLQGA
jgi:rSAM/selenodomain-associated transferase 1